MSLSVLNNVLSWIGGIRRIGSPTDFRDDNNTSHAPQRLMFAMLTTLFVVSFDATAHGQSGDLEIAFRAVQPRAVSLEIEQKPCLLSGSPGRIGKIPVISVEGLYRRVHEFDRQRGAMRWRQANLPLDVNIRLGIGMGLDMSVRRLQELAPDVQGYLTLASNENAFATRTSDGYAIVLDALWITEVTNQCQRLYKREYPRLGFTGGSNAFEWAGQVIVEHEVGHIVLAHLDARADVGTSVQRELEADGFAAFVVGFSHGKGNYERGDDNLWNFRSLDEEAAAASVVWRALWQDYDNSHPSSPKRIQAIRQGYLAGYRLSEQSPSRETKFAVRHALWDAARDGTLPEPVTIDTALVESLDWELYMD